MKIPVTPRFSIDEGELEEGFLHASAPGGQRIDLMDTVLIVNSFSLWA